MTEDNNLTLVSIGEVTIPFYREDGEIYVGLRPVVEAVGLSWRSQLNRIKRHPVLRQKMKTLSVFMKDLQGNVQHGEAVCLPKQYFSDFIFGISVERIKDAQVQVKVIQFQEEAYLFLDTDLTGFE